MPLPPGRDAIGARPFSAFAASQLLPGASLFSDPAQPVTFSFRAVITVREYNRRPRWPSCVTRSTGRAGGSLSSIISIMPEPFGETRLDAELSRLLWCWPVPDTPMMLPQRMARVLTGGRFSEHSPAAQTYQWNQEAKMKKCSACGEEFADKFSFCPVDGMPLNDLAATILRE